jgi:hypothetical protein
MTRRCELLFVLGTLLWGCPHVVAALRSPTDGVSTEQWKELAKISLDEFKSRRELEWKASLGFWAGIGSFTYVFVHDTGATRPPLWMLTTSYIIVGFISLFGLGLLQAGHALNRDYFFIL